MPGRQQYSTSLSLVVSVTEARLSPSEATTSWQRLEVTFLEHSASCSVSGDCTWGINTEMRVQTGQTVENWDKEGVSQMSRERRNKFSHQLETQMM